MLRRVVFKAYSEPAVNTEHLVREQPAFLHANLSGHSRASIVNHCFGLNLNAHVLLTAVLFRVTPNVSCFWSFYEALKQAIRSKRNCVWSLMQWFVGFVWCVCLVDDLVLVGWINCKREYDMWLKLLHENNLSDLTTMHLLCWNFTDQKVPTIWPTWWRSKPNFWKTLSYRSQI